MKLSALNIFDAVAKRAARTSTASTATVIGFAPPEDAPDVPDEVATPPALRPFRPNERVLKSELPGVSNEAWTDFVFAMKTGEKTAVSPSNGLGMFDIRYKRLQDLGLVTDLQYKRDLETNRSVQVANWVPPLTRDGFLASADAQLDVFVASMRAYFEEMRKKVIAMPTGCSVSGALAILHRGGRAALTKWADPTQRFEATTALFNITNGVF